MMEGCRPACNYDSRVTCWKKCQPAAGTLSAELVLLLLRQLRKCHTSRRDRATANWRHPSWVLWCILLLLLVALLSAGLLLGLACCIVCSCGFLMLQVDAVKAVHLQPHMRMIAE